MSGVTTAVRLAVFKCQWWMASCKLTPTLRSAPEPCASNGPTTESTGRHLNGLRLCEPECTL